MNFFNIGISLTHSTVAPLFDINIVGSPGSYTPRSPCTASQACRKTAGVPVLESVAAIFCATSPDLPKPHTNNLPLCDSIAFTAFAKFASSLSTVANIELASHFNTSRASDIISPSFMNCAFSKIPRQLQDRRECLCLSTRIASRQCQTSSPRL